MTAESFRQKIKGNFKTDDVTNYIASILFIGLSCYCFFRIIQDGLPADPTPKRYLIFIVPLVPMSFAFYALWRIPKDYLVYQIDSTKKVEEKITVIENYLTDVKVIWKSIESNYRTYRYKNKFLSKVDLRFYIDETKILYNIQGADTSGLKGVFDFGLTRRATKRLAEHLNASL